MTNIKLQKNALFAGLSYLILAITGLYALMYALPQIKIEGDIAKTIININNNPFLFRIGIVSILAMNIVSILLVIYLYRLLSKINKTMALSMLILMLFGAGVSVLNEVNHFAMLLINSIDSFSIEESLNLTNLFSTIHNHGTHIAVIFWGLWLFPLGALIYKLDTRISKFLGVMLLFAGAGYTLDSIFLFVYPNILKPTLSDYTSYGEILLMIWLLLKSNSIEKLVFARINIKANN
ncbi:DUF4386 domain-containing protein [Flagellimonas hymeniacidonis]|uniref:DUF4386 domain-containing protein n=1 Tax=Flagellimonas hymeniacidonis TaxID=2603628 RepID=A0A5C8V957_9FLAO|nr:DUF4386 domain-containing protein [Flagellimonas hymeniacidonis]TXN37298.1 DUF4386 domain-containing protein [Flagellimonas hymeniacidonis]